MNHPALDAETFHARFDGVQVWTSGSLLGDLETIAAHLEQAYGEVLRGEWVTLGTADPMGTIRAYAAHAELLDAELVSQGFRPPRMDYWTDPLGFLQHTAAFYRRIAPWVVEPARVLN